MMTNAVLRMIGPPLCSVALLFTTPPAISQVTPADASADFEALWQFVDENYAYFDDRLTVWSEVRKLYRPQLEKVRTKADLIPLFERMLAELYDPHAHLTVNTADSPPLIPSGTDLWAEWRDGKAIIVDVRQASAAAAAGVRPLAEVRAIDGVPVATAIQSRIGRSLRTADVAARSWALCVALAGRRGAPRRIEIVQDGRSRSIDLVPLEKQSGSDLLVTGRTLPGDIGLITILDSLGDTDLIARFDAVLFELRATSALILDFRNTPGGGNTTVARGILGRFVTKEMPYQRHVLVGEERSSGIRRSWLEMVSPRGPFTYRKPVAVLVNHWTGSMGEGLAMGFDATAAGTVVGTEMAGLLGATYHFELPHSRFGVNIPAERLSHVNGTPRESFRPRVYVSPDVMAASSSDSILDAALRTLRPAG